MDEHTVPFSQKQFREKTKMFNRIIIDYMNQDSNDETIIAIFQIGDWQFSEEMLASEFFKYPHIMLDDAMNKALCANRKQHSCENLTGGERTLEPLEKATEQIFENRDLYPYKYQTTIDKEEK